MREEADRLDLALSAPGEYAVGLVFLPHATPTREHCLAAFARVGVAEGQPLLGWHEVPTESVSISAMMITACCCYADLSAIFHPDGASNHAVPVMVSPKRMHPAAVPIVSPRALMIVAHPAAVLAVG